MHERYLGRIQTGMAVCDAKGSRVGSVARVYRYDSPAEVQRTVVDSDAPQDEVVEVKTGPFGLGKHLYVPLASIQEVVDDSVFLAVGGLEDDIAPFKQKPQYL